MKKILLAILAVSMAMPLVGFSKDVIKVGLDDAYPPMEYRDKNNELVGFDIDMAKAIAEELGVEIEFVPTAWDGVFAALRAGKYDAIISAVSIKPDRLKNYEFSIPYLSNGQVVVVRPGDDTINSVEDLAGKKVGVQLEATSDTAATKAQEKIKFKLTRYDEIIQTFADMKTGRLDCIVVDEPVAKEYVAKDPKHFKLSKTRLTNEPIGICCKKGNTELAEKFTAAIKKLQENGKMLEISQKWFGADLVSDIDEELK